LIRYSRAWGSYQDFLDEGCCYQRSYWIKGSHWLSWSHHFESFMTWITDTEYLFHKWPRLCFTCRKHFPILSSFMAYHWVCN
jgi:hypothetical protein